MNLSFTTELQRTICSNCFTRDHEYDHDRDSAIWYCLLCDINYCWNCRRECDRCDEHQYNNEEPCPGCVIDTCDGHVLCTLCLLDLVEEGEVAYCSSHDALVVLPPEAYNFFWVEGDDKKEQWSKAQRDYEEEIEECLLMHGHKATVDYCARNFPSYIRLSSRTTSS